MKYMRRTVIMILLASLLLSACSEAVTGFKILSMEEMKGRKPESMIVTFINHDNPVESSSITLSLHSPLNWPHIYSFCFFWEAAAALPQKEEKQFSPPAESSHHILMVFDNNSSLDFYYSQENDWLIWVNTTMEDDEKTIHYRFLSVDPSLKDLFALLKP